MSHQPLSELAKRRITKEYDLFRTNGPSHGFFLETPSSSHSSSSVPLESLSEWRVLFLAPDSSIYRGEQYLVSVSFPCSYPMDPPILKFVVDSTFSSPAHEHVYSNGIICMSHLAKSSAAKSSSPFSTSSSVAASLSTWSPAMTIESIFLSLQSMLCSAVERKRPKDDQRFVLYTGKNGERVRVDQLKWDFHDDKC
jgi:ubiquitin-protein ligase